MFFSLFDGAGELQGQQNGRNHHTYMNIEEEQMSKNVLLSLLQNPYKQVARHFFQILSGAIVITSIIKLSP